MINGAEFYVPYFCPNPRKDFWYLGSLNVI